MSDKITPQLVLDKAIDHCTAITGGGFPISLYPSKIQRIIREVNDCYGFPVDYVAAAMLEAVSVAIGNTHLARMKEGWDESAILYMALIGRPGANKSHPLSFAMRPFVEHDYEQNRIYEKQYLEYLEQLEMSRKERAEKGIEVCPREPVRRRFLVSDITPEGLSLVHSQNRRGLCLLSDELSAWVKNFNRYNNGSEEQFWLSVFSAKPTMSDRKSSRSSIFIKRPFVSVIGTMQKRILSELAKGERSANGFIDRILFVLLRHETSTRWSMKQPTFDVAAEWQRILSRLMELQCTVDENNDIVPVSIPFTEEAMVRLFKWQHELSDICDREPNETIVGIYCKLQIYAIRFCLIIQMARWACNDAGKDMIDLISVERAISLAEYFKESAVKVQTILKELSLTAQQLAIVSALPQEFETGGGIAVAMENGMAERTFMEFLKNNLGKLFQKSSHGKYIKL